MDKNLYFGLVSSSDGDDFYKLGDSVEAVMERLEKTPINNRTTWLVGIINLSNMELERIGESFVGRESIAKRRILEVYRCNSHYLI